MAPSSDARQRAAGGTGVRAVRGGSDYAELSRRVRSAGLLRRRPLRSAARLVGTGVLTALGWMLFVIVGDSWWQLAVAVVLAFAFTQCGFRGHEAGHRQLFSNKCACDLTGLFFGNLLIGLGFGWWVDKHNRHHAHPNQPERDPDIGTGVLVFIPGDAAARRGVRAWWTRHQAALFFPLLLMEGWNLHVASVRALRHRRPGAPAPIAVEGALLLLHAAAYFTALALVLSPAKLVVFTLVQQGLFGLYLGASFAPNHKGMPMPSAEDKLDFLRTQVLTSRNVRGGRVTAYMLGSLNYQIEHHLFPSMPSHSLPQAQLLVREHCEALGLPYAETGIFDSYRQALDHLHAVGAGAPPPAAHPG
ncbi:fatty acid desaturase family protein [Streptomyces sp. G7(2002)]|uniref:fatty acid desaturase family protein n=1 Tax=Streptomyces sp. G7(2002) TaxID=2971798 RepID=UPI00237EAD64|nr:acyl-CoA desaturase [Streptomyces sp. G7(2002)]WDT58509.1 acyl-CoA desaturase [Streptomyces sp. G7(2002)]